MKSLLRRRPSPALIIAVIALFISLSGVSYGVATGFIDSREIQNNQVRSVDIRNNEIRTKDLRNNEIRGIDVRNSTIQSRDIAINAVRGEDVKEDTLQKVPSALLADSATTASTATNADSVGGVAMSRISYSAQTGSDFVEVLNAGGLRLEARCNGGPPDLEVRANPDAANAELSSVFNRGTPYEFDFDFDPGDNVLVVDDAPGPGLISFAGADGRIVTIHAQAVQNLNDVRGTTDDCGFFGVAEVS